MIEEKRTITRKQFEKAIKENVTISDMWSSLGEQKKVTITECQLAQAFSDVYLNNEHLFPWTVWKHLTAPEK